MPPRDNNDSQQERYALGAALLQELGGALNLSRLGHCTTRLRIRVKDSKRVNLSAIKSHDAIFNVLRQGNELQIICHSNVDLLCAAMQAMVGLKEDHDLDDVNNSWLKKLTQNSHSNSVSTATAATSLLALAPKEQVQPNAPATIFTPAASTATSGASAYTAADAADDAAAQIAALFTQNAAHPASTPANSALLSTPAATGNEETDTAHAVAALAAAHPELAAALRNEQSADTAKDTDTEQSPAPAASPSATLAATTTPVADTTGVATTAAPAPDHSSAQIPQQPSKCSDTEIALDSIYASCSATATAFYNITSTTATTALEAPVHKPHYHTWKEQGAMLFAYVTGMIGAVILPLVGFMAMGGLIKSVVTLLVSLEVLQSTDSIVGYTNSIFELIFQFLPVLLGYTCSRWLCSNPLVGITLGMCLVPTVYQQLSTLMPWHEQLITPLLINLQELLSSRFNYSVYSVSVIPIIVATAINARLECYINSLLPHRLHYLATAFLCLCVGVPLMILFIAPIFTAVGYASSDLLLSLFEQTPWLLGLLVGALWEFLVSLGMHWILSPTMFNNISFLGYDMLVAVTLAPTFATGGAMVGLYIYQRCHGVHTRGADAGMAFTSEEQAATRHASLLAILLGITEPTLYSFLVQRSKLFMLICVISGIGGMIISMLGLCLRTITMTGSFALLMAYKIDNPHTPTAALYLALICGGCFTVALLTSFLWLKKDQRKAQKKAQEQHEQLMATALTAVCAGTYTPLNEVADPIFSSLMVGDGYAIQPAEDVLYAPCDGTLSPDIDFAHAVGIKGPLGSEILLHAGINTVRLEGKYFTLLKEPNSQVKRGEALLRFEREEIAAAGFDPTVIVVCTLPSGVQLKHEAGVTGGMRVTPEQVMVRLQEEATA